MGGGGRGERSSESRGGGRGGGRGGRWGRCMRGVGRGGE